MELKRIFIVFFLFFFLSPVLAMESTQKCLNSTHLQYIVRWTECDGTCTDKNITQTINCTMPMDSTDRCDTSVNQCKHVRESEAGDVIAFAATTFLTGTFFFLGLKVQPGKEFSLLKNGLQTLFFIVGCWMLILEAGMAETIAVSTGVSESTLNLVVQSVITMSRVMYVVMFLLVVSYFVSALWVMIPKKGRS